MADPKRVFDKTDSEPSALYAKRVAASDDTYPVLVKSDGSLIVSLTSGTVSIDTTGLATSAKQDTQITAEQAIQTAVEILDNIVSGSEAQVDIVSSALPSGASTLAEQQSQTTHLGNIVGDTANIEAAVQIVDDWDESDRCKVNPIAGQAGVAAGVGATGATVQRVVLANDQGRSLTSSSGTLTATSGVLVLGGNNKTKVYAFSLTTTSTTGVICSFHSGGYAGTELWRVLLQAPSGANAGANLAVTPPAFLFQTASNGTLRLNLSASVRVDFSVAYYDEA